MGDRKGVDLEGKWGGTGCSRWRGIHNQDILYEERIFFQWKNNFKSELAYWRDQVTPGTVGELLVSASSASSSISISHWCWTCKVLPWSWLFWDQRRGVELNLLQHSCPGIPTCFYSLECIPSLAQPSCQAVLAALLAAVGTRPFYGQFSLQSALGLLIGLGSPAKDSAPHLVN